MGQEGYIISNRFNEYEKILNVLHCYIENDAEKPISILKRVEADPLLEKLRKDRGEGLTKTQIDHVIALLLYYIPDEIKNN